MSRSDSSVLPDHGIGVGRISRGLPRSRTSLFPPSQRQPRRGLLCRASPSRAGSPIRSAESRSLSFRAGVWIRPFIVNLTVDNCLLLREVLRSHRSSRRDLNPLGTCAARRTYAPAFAGADSLPTKVGRWRAAPASGKVQLAATIGLKDEKTLILPFRKCSQVMSTDGG